jgi:hypothetical protein
VAKVYLETSFFSACVSTRRSPGSRGWRAISNAWWQQESRRYELFISPEVIQELTATDFKNRRNAVEMLQGLKLLEQTQEVAALAQLLVKEHVMPGPSVEGDAIHVAAATIHQMDYLLTWNVKHLANPNKRTHFGIICMRLNLVAPQLVTPDFL